jgi:hypothetical protein
VGVLANRYRAAVRDAYDRRSQDPDVLPAVLSAACVEVLPVTGAGLTLTDRLRVPLGASSLEVGVAERLQVTLGEGPCLSAAAAAEPLLASQVTMARWWPTYHRELSEQTRFRSVAALPLGTAGEHPFGSLQLYSIEDELDPSLVDEQVRADVVEPIAQLLLGAPSTAVSWSGDPVAVWLDGPSVRRRLEVWAAVGMVMSTGATSEEDALSLLRAYAFGHEMALDDVAQLVLSHRLAPATLRI